MTAPIAAIEHVCKQVERFSSKVKLGNEGRRTVVARVNTTALVLLSTILEKECVLSGHPRDRSRPGAGTCPVSHNKRDDVRNAAASPQITKCVKQVESGLLSASPSAT